ncbi:MAG: hypothetical protein F6Q13_17085 [Mycobacterium sp.]|nr:MAG: hypothetical protein F6Q13_17085 [Mycobacterium sp.]
MGSLGSTGALGNGSAGAGAGSGPGAAGARGNGGAGGGSTGGRATGGGSTLGAGGGSGSGASAKLPGDSGVRTGIFPSRYFWMSGTSGLNTVPAWVALGRRSRITNVFVFGS